MATVIPKANRIVQDQPQQAFYMVSIDTSNFLDTETNNGGRISPCVAEDFATAPTTLAQSRLINRGALRYKKMLELLQVRSNVSVTNILTTYASDAGDQAITKLQFGLVYDNDNFIQDNTKTLVTPSVPGWPFACHRAKGPFARWHDLVPDLCRATDNHFELRHESF